MANETIKHYSLAKLLLRWYGKTITKNEENCMNKLKRACLYFVLACTLIVSNVITVMADHPNDIQLNDATGGVDREFTVTATLSTAGTPIGDATIRFTYDPEVIEFVGGADGTEASSEGGSVTMFRSGLDTGAETTLDYAVIFRGVAEGTTQLTIFEYITWYADGGVLMANFNSATVTVTEDGEGGAPTGTSAEFEINGTMYTIFDNFTEAMVPTGFTKIQRDVHGSTHNAIVQDVSGNVFMYLVAGQNDPVMALFDEATVDFTLAGMEWLTSDSYIIILDRVPGTTLPPNFQPTSLNFYGTYFPAWQNMDFQDFFLVFALNSLGNEGFYQYDDVDGTFQRFIVPDVAPGEEAGDEENGVAEGIVGLLRDNILIVALFGLLVVLVLLIIIIITSAKLSRRNAELDEMYNNEYDDRYDDDYDDYDDYDDEDDYDDYDDDYDDEDDDYDDEDGEKGKDYGINFVDV